VTTTFLVLGDQLSTEVAPWPDLPKDTVILMIESQNLIRQPRHLTRVSLYLSAMRQFAQRVSDLGFTVDYQKAESFTAGVAAHRKKFKPDSISMNMPRGRHAISLFTTLGVLLNPDPFYLTDLEEMKARKKRPATLENFQREQRRRLNLLMDGDEPVGGQWNFDSSNREPLPRDGGTWPDTWMQPLDSTEENLVTELKGSHPGGDALAFWPRTREQALDQLRDAVERIIPRFGPHEDAASADNWHLAHSRLSPALNMGLLHPREVVNAVVEAFNSGFIPLESTEGFIRQVTGWREWVWLLHHLRDDDYENLNYLNATNPLPEVWEKMGGHEMRCLNAVLSHLHDYGWNHHIERLMVLANAATLAGIDPLALSNWMATAYVDGAQWVMEANVIGMGTFGDGGQTATKPYIGGGNYISKMTNFCKGCKFSPTTRTGEDACPLTTLYWDFLIRNEEKLAKFNRIAPQRRAALTRPDRNEIQAQAPTATKIVLQNYKSSK
jgi:deoxyribodipyrimidine photolyase-related protein